MKGSTNYSDENIFIYVFAKIYKNDSNKFDGQKSKPR